MIESLLFDLDGTLVHTAPGILACFRATLDQAAVAPIAAIDERVIGPPLMATLERLTGITDATVLDRLATSFKAMYDTEGVRHADPYPGTGEALEAFAKAGRRLFVVTNKRAHPTRLILDRFGWTPLFTGIYSPDSFAPPARKKAATLERVLADHTIRPDRALFIGDSVDDADAAGAHHMRFIAVTYGYGTPVATDRSPPAATIAAISDLATTVARLD